ncbi:MAG: hypothetical protein KZQ80_17555 [Candidatus Thiodiazotropha sp. (ex Monitilora ramsayi)]|nr:hypothetical protein [Candidatus Thiodiazotropha sp. (ex Monitilora ramsayi)]
MGKIKDPVNFSTAFGIDKGKINATGVVDVILNADTNLFIDPLLLEDSRHQEIAQSGNSRYRQHFETVIKLLVASKAEGDVAWRNAKRRFQFHEIPWTCLGYGGTVRGSGFGNELIASTLATAKEIVELGVSDVDLFMALALFEEGIGPDRISDMTTNIILPDLLSFNERVINELALTPSEHIINGNKYPLLTNLCSERGEPLLLVPVDVVRDLPIATDWSDISRVVSENENLRDRVSSHVGEIWATMSRKEKARLKNAALRSKESFNTVLEMLHQSKGLAYDIKSDMGGEVFWGDLVTSIAANYPKDLSGYKGVALNQDIVFKVVGEIIDQFQYLVEKRDLWRELWDEKLECHRKEKAAQRLFFAVADSYCKSNGLDLTPEAETGNGPVDFKVSTGYAGRVLVEIKLSANPRLLHGYEKQLEIYRDAEQTFNAYFLVIDVGGLGKKDQQLIYLKNQQTKSGHKASEIVFVNGLPRESASKRV